MIEENKTGYCPPDKEDEIKCDFCNCFAGGGMAGRGCCFLNGHWWLKDCPEFQSEDEKLLEQEFMDKFGKVINKDIRVEWGGKLLTTLPFHEIKQIIENAGQTLRYFIDRMDEWLKGGGDNR